MKAGALSLSLVLAAGTFVATGATAHGDDPPATAPGIVAARGFMPSTFAEEKRAETLVESGPSEAAALRYERALASQVHRMGSQQDYATAKYVRDTLAAAGWDAKIVTYDVPIDTPVEQSLTLIGSPERPLNLYESEVPGDAYSTHHGEIGIPYSGYSSDGDVTGPVVYANYARPEDFDELAKRGIDLKDAIVLARIGKGTLTGKAFEAAKHGAAATLIFSDPMDSGFFKGDVYPNGPWRPTGNSIRNTMTFTNNPGDPTAIGIPFPGATHKPFSAIVVPSIPEMPITGDVAQQLIAAMGGPDAPPDWHGGFPLPLHLGGQARAHFVLRSKRTFGPIWDVIATLRGVDPAQSVMVGGHRDAWTYGAVDPISGTVDLLQLGVALGEAYQAGWHPERTITIGSWDGEELNLFGSEIWVEQHDSELRDGLVAYVNTDEVAYGPTFGAYATPELGPMLRDAARDVKAPDGSMLEAYWRAQDPKEAVDQPGGGSDHEPFEYHESLPVAGGGFTGPFGTYHSAYDDIASLRIYDPGMHRAAAAARFTSLVVMRLAGATVPDLRLVPLADALRDRVNAWAAIDKSPRRADVKRSLDGPLGAFARRAAVIDGRLNSALSGGRTGDATCDYRDLRITESAFYHPDSVDGKGWARSLLYGLTDGAYLLPTLDATLDSGSGQKAQGDLVAALNAADIDTRCGAAPTPPPQPTRPPTAEPSVSITNAPSSPPAAPTPTPTPAKTTASPSASPKPAAPASKAPTATPDPGA